VFETVRFAYRDKEVVGVFFVRFSCAASLGNVICPVRQLPQQAAHKPDTVSPYTRKPASRW
jgi:hypothetical protein